MMNPYCRILALSFVLSLALACSGVQPEEPRTTEEDNTRIIPRTERTSVSSRLNPPSGIKRIRSDKGTSAIQKQKKIRRQKAGKKSKDRVKTFPEGYAKWTKLTNAPIYRDGSEEVWTMYMGPKTKLDSNVFVSGSTLVKEIRAATRKGSEIIGGEPLVVAVMHKTTKGTWRMAAYDPNTKKPADDVDTDGCMLCHQSRKETDYSFRAYARLMPKPEVIAETKPKEEKPQPVQEQPSDYIGSDPAAGGLVHPSEDEMPAIHKALRRTRCPRRTEFSGTTIEPMVPRTQVFLGSFSAANKNEALVRVFDCMGPQDDANPNVDAYEVLVHLKKRRNRWSAHAVHKVSAITGWYRFESDVQRHRLVIRSDKNTTGTASFGASKESHEAKFNILNFKRRTVRVEPLFTLTYMESGLCSESIVTRWDSKQVDDDDLWDLSANVSIESCDPVQKTSFGVVFVNRGGSFLPNRKTMESINSAR
ncbi:MAG: hypothetical protein CMH54_09240 [Myxococcales bacterium]|nr:hypothetical protein [Myxococcales bacterium]